LREKGVLGTLDIFGGVGYGSTLPADYDNMVRERIDPAYWKDHRVDVIYFLGGDPEHRGMTCGLKLGYEKVVYYGIWFDKRQIDALYPSGGSRK
jgi:hypothetical protein